jgi:hypothetical protein
VTIELAPAEERSMSSTEMANRWRDLTGPLPDALEQSYTASLFRAGEDVNVQLTGPSIEDLRLVADELKERIDSLVEGLGA